MKFIVICREEGIKLLQTESLKAKAQAIQFLLDHNIKEFGKEQLSSSLHTATSVLKGQFLLQVRLFIKTD